MTPTNGVPHEPASDLMTVRLRADGGIEVRRPVGPAFVLTPDDALQLCGPRMRDLLKMAVLDSRGGITLKARKDQ